MVQRAQLIVHHDSRRPRDDSEIPIFQSWNRKLPRAKYLASHQPWCRLMYYLAERSSLVPGEASRDLIYRNAPIAY